MSENTDAANDYALARVMNEQVIAIFKRMDDQRDLPDYSALNRSYVLLREELKQIYARQPELQAAGGSICWKVMPNIELFHENIGEYKSLAFEYSQAAADYGDEHNTNVNMLCINAKIDKPVIPPHIKTLLAEAENNLKAFEYEFDKMNATLSIGGFTIPVVTIGEKEYHLTSMRGGGLVLSIIEHCLKNHPNEQIDFDTLKEELNDQDITVPAKKSIRELIRKSRFGDGKPLKPFVSAYPKAIMVRQKVELNDEQIEQIALASV